MRTLQVRDFLDYCYISMRADSQLTAEPFFLAGRVIQVTTGLKGEWGESSIISVIIILIPYPFVLLEAFFGHASS